jgi:serine/threonine protein kinase
MGIVWLADDLIEDRQVALKRPHATGGDVRADLEREADIARRIAHPNVIAVHGVVGGG